MQQSPKASEPSMEEILASIRKIIADDPAAKPSAPPPSPVASVAPQPTAPAPVASANAKPTERRAAADLDRELADLIGEPINGLREPSFGAPSPAAVATPAAAAEAAPSSRFGWIRGRSGGQAGAQSGGQSGAQASSHALPQFGATTPSNESESARRTPVTETPESAKFDRQPAPAAKVEFAGVQPVTELAPAPAQAPVTVAQPVPTAQPAARPVVVAAPVARPVASSPDPAVETVKPARAVAQPAASVEVASAAETLQPALDLAPPITAAAKIAVVSADAPSREQSVSPPLAASPNSAATGMQKTVEDTLAELLRPMVRQWLDENMSRAIEKAIRVEVASSVKTAVGKPGGGDKS